MKINTFNLLLWILRDEFPPDIIYAISKFLPKKMKDESKVEMDGEEYSLGEQIQLVVA